MKIKSEIVENIKCKNDIKQENEPRLMISNNGDLVVLAYNFRRVVKWPNDYDGFSGILLYTLQNGNRIGEISNYWAGSFKNFDGSLILKNIE